MPPALKMLLSCIGVTSSILIGYKHAANSCLLSFVVPESKSRFATLSQEDFKNLLLDDKHAKSSKRASKSALKVFHQYLKEKKEPQTKDTLANVLKLFYAEARKADGTALLIQITYAVYMQALMCAR